MAIFDPTTGKKLDKIYTKQATDRKPIMKIVTKVDGQRKTIYYHPDYTIQKLWVDAGYFTWFDTNKNRLAITDLGLQQEYLPDVSDGQQLTSIERLYPDKYSIRYNVLRRFPIIDLSNVENANEAFTGLKTEGALVLRLPKLKTAMSMFYVNLDDGYITDITLHVPNKVDFTQAFAGRHGLHNITITGNGHIVDYMCQECSDLRQLYLNLPNTPSIDGIVCYTDTAHFTSDFSDVKSMSYAYGNTQNILEFTENADQVEVLDNAFSWSNIRKVVIKSPYINTLESTFENCMFLKEVSLNIQGECILDNAFLENVLLEHLTLGAIRDNIDLSTSPLITHESARRILTDAYKVGEPNTNVKTITFHQQVIDKLSHAEIKIATDKGWNILPTKPPVTGTIQTEWIDAGLFTWADTNKNRVLPTNAGREALIIPDVTDGEQLTHASEMFMDTKATVMPMVNLSNVTTMYRGFMRANMKDVALDLPKCTNVYELLAGSTTESVLLNTPICTSFERCFQNSVVKDYRVIANNIVNISYMFDGNKQLRHITFDMSRVTHAGYALASTSIEWIDVDMPQLVEATGMCQNTPIRFFKSAIPKLNGASSMFYNCPDLYSFITYTGKESEKMIQGGWFSNMFSGCSALVEMRMFIRQIASLENLLSGCVRLETVQLGHIYENVNIASSPLLNIPILEASIEELGQVSSPGSNHRSIALHANVVAQLSEHIKKRIHEKGWQLIG